MKKITKQLQAQCLHCTKTFVYIASRTHGKYCSNACNALAMKQRTEALYEQGLIAERSTLKAIYTRRNGYQCSKCGITDWQGLPLTLQLDHIDGNPSNNFPTNIRVLCPNCHSQTPHWGARNKGSGRKSRGLPLR